MDDNKKNDGFADIVINGTDSDSNGFSIPPKNPKNAENSKAHAGVSNAAKSANNDYRFGRSRYTGRGAYSWNFGESKEKLCFSYKSDLAFIGEVQVFSWGAKRSFYEKFREDALRYRRMTSAEPVQEVPFFSYIPQYSQMNAYQSRFYLYFRDMALRGEYVRADLSYILLYIYELINLSDISDNTKDIDILCGLWMAYRNTYPALDKYMAEWVCDYCLLYRLDVPECTLAILPKLCESASLREFYMSGAVKSSVNLDGGILGAFADYDWRRSRVCIPEDLKAHFPAALEAACSIYESSYFVGEKPMYVTRDAFCGSLCAHNIKRRIKAEYYPAFRKNGARHMLGAVVKYTENKLRRAAGIKSRLHIDGLPDAAKQKIDEYFANAMPEIFKPQRLRSKERDSFTEYEKFYDAPDIPFSAESAARIERESRAAADMLSSFGEKFGENEHISDVPDISDDAPAIASPKTTNGTCGAETLISPTMPTLPNSTSAPAAPSAPTMPTSPITPNSPSAPATPISPSAPISSNATTTTPITPSDGGACLAENTEIAETGGADGDDYIKDALKYMLEGGLLEDYCKKHAILPDTAAAEINEAAMDFFGDVMLERGDDGWQLIVDYLEEAAEMAVSGESL